MKLYKYFSFLFIFSLSFSTSIYGATAITFYDGENETGASLKITGDAPSLGSMDQKMSSYRLTPGYAVQLYFQTDFQGGFYTVNDQTDHEAIMTSSNNRVRSVKVTKYDPSSEIAAIIYRDENYSGDYLEIRGDTAYWAGFGATIGSFQVSPGYEIRLYERSNFKGDNYYTRDSNSSDDASTSFEERSIHSLKITKRPPSDEDDGTTTGSTQQSTAVTIWTGPNFTGNSFNVTQDMSSLGSGWNDNIGSFKVASGYSVRFFEGANFSGGYYSKESTASESANPSYGKRISSIKILTTSTPPTTTTEPTVVTIYQRANYQGQSLNITQNIANLPSDWNDNIGSFKIKDGYSIRFFKHANYSGDYYSKESTAKEAADPSYGKEISSIKIIGTPQDKTGNGQNPDGSIELSKTTSAASIIATIYSGPNYTGQAYTIRGNAPRFTTVPNEQITFGSLKINKPGFIVRTFTKSFYASGFFSRESDVSNESPLKVIKSVLLLKPGRNAEVGSYYTDANLKKNTNVVMREADVSDMGSNRNKMSSVFLQNGWVARFYDNTGFQGSTVGLGLTQSSVGGFNDKAESYIVYPDPCPVAITLYGHENFKGSSTLQLRRSTTSLHTYNWGVYTRSWKVTPGFKVTLYDYENYGGRYKTFTGNTAQFVLFDPTSVKVTERPAEHVGCDQ